jgi:hypothetical protein
VQNRAQSNASASYLRDAGNKVCDLRHCSGPGSLVARNGMSCGGRRQRATGTHGAWRPTARGALALRSAEHTKTSGRMRRGGGAEIEGRREGDGENVQTTAKPRRWSASINRPDFGLGNAPRNPFWPGRREGEGKMTVGASLPKGSSVWLSGSGSEPFRKRGDIL